MVARGDAPSGRLDAVERELGQRQVHRHRQRRTLDHGAGPSLGRVSGRDSWLRLRLLGGVGFALLLVLLAQGYYYRLVDLPDLQREWKEHQADMLHQHGADANSTEAIQIGKNIESGDVVGFSVSRNTYAALLVFLGMVSLGIALQRLADRDHPGWVVPIVIVLVLSLLMLYRYVQSKTAYATPLLGAALIAVLWRRRDWISARSRRLYWITIVAFVIGIVAVMGHGLKHGSLFQLSLTYRWQYWVGAARLLVHHPWLGVGWGNFGQSYLGFRLPQAVEEIKDPHNFLIRAGRAGNPRRAAHARVDAAALVGIDAASRLRRRIRLRPRSRRGPPRRHPVFASGPNHRGRAQRGDRHRLAAERPVDHSRAVQAGDFFPVAGRRPGHRDPSVHAAAGAGRPARPWLLASILVAGGLFLLHNLIDFSLFEPGPMFVFALLCGGALGLRLKENPRRPFGTALTIGATVLGGVVWLVAAGGGAWNVAAGGIDGARRRRNGSRSGQGGAAVPRLLDASRLVPINPDYAYRAALLAHDNPLMAREMLAAAITADPMSVRYHRAMAELDANQHEWTNSLAEYRKAVELDPNNIELRIEFAELLRRRGEVAERGDGSISAPWS